MPSDGLPPLAQASRESVSASASWSIRASATLRARGHSHARTLRSLADRWLRILTAMLTTGTAYDASRFAVAAPTP